MAGGGGSLDELLAGKLAANQHGASGILSVLIAAAAGFLLFGLLVPGLGVLSMILGALLGGGIAAMLGLRRRRQRAAQLAQAREEQLAAHRRAMLTGGTDERP